MPINMPSWLNPCFGNRANPKPDMKVISMPPKQQSEARNRDTSSMSCATTLIRKRLICLANFLGGEHVMSKPSEFCHYREGNVLNRI